MTHFIVFGLDLRSKTRVDYPAQAGAADRLGQSGAIGNRRLWVVASFLLVAWGLRLFVYAPEELGLDGYLSVGLALLPFDRFFTFLTRDVHPPLYYVLLKAWLAVAGTNVLAARWLSVAAGLVTLVVLYRWTAALVGPRGAILGLVLLVLSPAHVITAATARDFGLGLLLSASTLVVWHALDRRRPSAERRWLLVALAVLTALALATWYFHALFVAVLFLDVVFRARARRGPALALALGVALQAPWLAFAAPPLIAKVAGGTTASGESPALALWSEMAAHLGYSLGGVAPGPLPDTSGAVAWLLLLFAGLGVGLSRGGDTARWVGLATAGVLFGFVAIYALSSAWAEPDLLGRYGMIVLPWALLSHAWLLDSTTRVLAGGPTTLVASWLTPRRLSFVLAGVVIVSQVNAVLAVAHSIPIAWSTEPFIAVVESEGLPGDAVVATDHAKYGVLAARRETELPIVSIHIAGPAFLRDDVPDLSPILLGPLLRRHERIWLSYDLPVDQSSVDEIQTWLGTDRFLVRHDERESVVVRLFAPGPPLANLPISERFGDSIDVEHAAISSSVRPGNPLFVELRWRAASQPETDYQVFAHLIDGRGERLAQYDGAPVLGLRPTSGWRPGELVVDRFVVPVPADAQPGDPTLVRVGWVVGSFLLLPAAPFGLLLYLVLAIIIPPEPYD